MSVKPQQRERSTSKKSRNAADYLSSKSKQDHVLLRLEKGDRARLDAACATSGISRASFARLYLMPVVDALSSRLRDIEQARAVHKVSLQTFLERAIDLAVKPTQEDAAPPVEVTNEFDAIFGSVDGGG